MCSEINHDVNNLIFHCSPDFGIPKGQERRNIIVVPNDDDGDENVLESKSDEKLPVIYDDRSISDITYEQRHLAARAYALGHEDPKPNSVKHKCKSYFIFNLI